MIKTKQTKTETFKIKSHRGFPPTIGIVGVALAPILAAIGTVTALVTECSVVVEREI